MILEQFTWNELQQSDGVLLAVQGLHGVQVAEHVTDWLWTDHGAGVWGRFQMLDTS